MTTAPHPVQTADQLFVNRIPDLQRYTSFKLRDYPRIERDEAIAEAVAAGFLLFRGLSSRGRTDVIGKPGFLNYAVRHVLKDKHVGSSSTTRDVMNRVTQYRRGFRHQSFSVPLANGDCLESLIEDRKNGPADTAAFRIDWGNWMAGIPARDKKIMALLAAGESARHVAQKFHLTVARISQLRSEWREGWNVYQGEAVDALAGEPV